MKESILLGLFRDISAIPHASFNEKALSDWVKAFGEKLGLETKQDVFNNVLIRKPATKGYEKAPVVMLQAHLDMVAEKNNDSDHNFDTDPLDLRIKDGVLFANKTTLGADDGVGIVYMLALLQDNTLEHPELECVFTVEEEVGLLGATNFDTSDLKAALCVGLDSSGEKYVTVSSCGGVRGSISRDIRYVNKDTETVLIKIRGLHGGHSGGDIHLEKGNAIKIAGILLKRSQEKFKINLANVQGGLKINAIPREIDVEVAVEDVYAYIEFLELLEKEFLAQFEISDAGLTFEHSISKTTSVLSDEDTNDIIDLMFMLPYGVIQKSMAIKDLVITSANIGTANTYDDHVEINVSLRATQTFVLETVMEQVNWIAHTKGFNTAFSAQYPGWNYEPNSEFRRKLFEVYEDLRGEPMIEEATHGGLELGIWKGKMPHLDIIGLGPIMYDIHTPNERLDLESFERTYEVLVELLKRANEI